MTTNAVVTPHHQSAHAARRVLTRGGNAVDAALAAVVAQGVVAPETCGLGGDLFALIHQPGWDRPRALNASGRAGSGANANTLRSEGHTGVPRDHPMTVTIPGCVDGLVALSESHGRQPFEQALTPAIELASDGFEVSTEQADAFSRTAEMYRGNPAVADFYPEGNPVAKEAIVRRPDLARTLRDLAQGGRDAFYRGPPGEDIVAALGGTIAHEDMEDPQAEWVDPISVELAGLQAWTLPANTQGYLGPATLSIFEMLQPSENTDDPAWWHLLIEAYRCMAWERNDVIADPDHAPLPPELLLDRARLERAAATISPDVAGVWPDRLGAASGTAYLCVADGAGMAVSIIQSNYRGTGSAFGAARSGFLLHDRGGGFSLTPGHPNEMAPGKRPLHTLSPTLWTDGTRPRWLLGTRGGAVQPQLIAQVGARGILHSDDLTRAQEAPRWTVQDFGPGSPPQLFLEPDTPETVVDGLRSRGHHVDLLDDPQPSWGPVSIIELDGDTRHAAADPRVDTTTALVW